MTEKRLNTDATNLELENLYLSEWESMSNALLSFNEEDPGDDENRATNPLLLQIDSSYANADLKVMFFGQETNSWGGEFNDGVFDEDVNIQLLFSLYKSFYLERKCESYGKPFWNFMKRIQSYNYPCNVGYVWNNVLKIGKQESGTPQNGLIDYTKTYFDVIPKEIEILKPDVLLFFTGPKYDEHINKFVGDFTITSVDGFNTNELCILNFTNLPNRIALRTYHPQFLQRLGKAKLDIYYNRIIEFILSV